MDSVPESMETSMQRDQAAGRPIELDALGGALLRRAQKAGIAVPVAKRLVDDLQSRSGLVISTGP
jgi:2-dehydropantoate 2-reductase